MTRMVIRQHIVVSPTAIAELAPLISCFSGSAYEDHTVHGTGTTQCATRRPIDFTSDGRVTLLRKVLPDELWVRKQFPQAVRRMYPHIVIRSAGFQKQYAPCSNPCGKIAQRVRL